MSNIFFDGTEPYHLVRQINHEGETFFIGNLQSGDVSISRLNQSAKTLDPIVFPGASGGLDGTGGSNIIGGVAAKNTFIKCQMPNSLFALWIIREGSTTVDPLIHPNIITNTDTPTIPDTDPKHYNHGFGSAMIPFNAAGKIYIQGFYPEKGYGAWRLDQGGTVFTQLIGLGRSGTNSTTPWSSFDSVGLNPEIFLEPISLVGVEDYDWSMSGDFFFYVYGFRKTDSENGPIAIWRIDGTQAIALVYPGLLGNLDGNRHRSLQPPFKYYELNNPTGGFIYFLGENNFQSAINSNNIDDAVSLYCIEIGTNNITVPIYPQSPPGTDPGMSTADSDGTGFAKCYRAPHFLISCRGNTFLQLGAANSGVHIWQILPDGTPVPRIHSKLTYPFSFLAFADSSLPQDSSTQGSNVFNWECNGRCFWAVGYNGGTRANLYRIEDNGSFTLLVNMLAIKSKAGQGYDVVLENDLVCKCGQTCLWLGNLSYSAYTMQIIDSGGGASGIDFSTMEQVIGGPVYPSASNSLFFTQVVYPDRIVLPVNKIACCGDWPIIWGTFTFGGTGTKGAIWVINPTNKKAEARIWEDNPDPLFRLPTLFPPDTSSGHLPCGENCYITPDRTSLYHVEPTNATFTPLIHPLLSGVQENSFDLDFFFINSISPIFSKGHYECNNGQCLLSAGGDDSLGLWILKGAKDPVGLIHPNLTGLFNGTSWKHFVSTGSRRETALVPHPLLSNKAFFAAINSNDQLAIWEINCQNETICAVVHPLLGNSGNIVSAPGSRTTYNYIFENKEEIFAYGQKSDGALQILSIPSSASTKPILQILQKCEPEQEIKCKKTRFRCLALKPGQTRVTLAPWDRLDIAIPVNSIFDKLYLVFPKKACNGDQISVKNGRAKQLELDTLDTAEPVKIKPNSSIIWIYCCNLKPHWMIFTAG